MTRQLTLSVVLGLGLGTPMWVSAQAPAPPPAPAPVVRAAPVPAQVPTAAPVPGEGYAFESYSPRLGIHYVLTAQGPYYGARLTQPPTLYSPLRQAQVQLEPGDLITYLDGMPVTSPQELENHYAQTTITFVNVRTGYQESRSVFLPNTPGPGPGPGPMPPGPMPGAYVLGVQTVPVSVNVGAVAYAAPAPGFPAPPMPAPATVGLRVVSVSPGSAAAYAGLRPGDTLLTANSLSTNSQFALKQAIDTSNGVLNLTVLDGQTNSVRTLSANLAGPPVYAAPAAAPTVGAPAPVPPPTSGS